jgi:hypothetical protein
MKKFTPDQWSSFFGRQPESGMGYFIGDITLCDGREFKDAIFVEGNITKIRGLADIPFETQDIKMVQVTGRRWDWSE